MKILTNSQGKPLDIDGKLIEAPQAENKLAKIFSNEPVTLTPEDFGTATGIVSVPVSIVIDGTTEVGALTSEEYKVYVNITEKEVEE